MNRSWQPGKLVSLRGREWIVLPSDDPDLLVVKPLGGSDEEVTGVFLPLEIPEISHKMPPFPIRPTKILEISQLRVSFMMLPVWLSVMGLDHFDPSLSCPSVREPTKLCPWLWLCGRIPSDC